MVIKVMMEVYKTSNCFNAYAPNFPGCFATGKTVEEAKIHLSEALEDHIPAYLESGGTLPDELYDYDVIKVTVPSLQTKDITGETLREYRKRNKLTQDELASKLEVAKDTVSAWERGARELPGTVRMWLEAVC